MKDLFYRSLSFSALILILWSCQEELTGDVDPSSQLSKSESTRLVFGSIAEFEGLMSQMDPASTQDYEKVLQSKTKEFPKFHSLQKTILKTVEENSPNFRALEVEPEFLLDSIIELVPDIALRSFLNEDMEIEIEGMIYKVTSYGTFGCPSDKYEKLLEVIENFNPNARIASGTLGGVEGDDGIIFEDTFGGGNGSGGSSGGSSTNNLIMSQPNDFSPLSPYLYAWPKSVYDSFTAHSYGANTTVGKLFEGTFGGNTVYEENYTSKFRFRVKVFDYNYIFYRSVGLNGKLQKKGWTGIWATQNEVRAEKMVLGWDGLLLSIKIPYTLPAGYTSFPSKGVSKEILKFTNFSLPNGNLTSVRIPFLGVQPIAYNDIEKMLKGTLKKSYSEITKAIWKDAESSFASASLAIKQQDLKSYRVVFPDEIKINLSRYEIVGTNENELSFIIDRFVGIEYSATGTGAPTSFSQNVLQPTLSNVKKMHKIDAAAVYGGAEFLGDIKGVRVIKELND
ncbi:hypothetical protein [Algoriphagus sediminis]|uniref:Uncharacterized protein n=1 Tax=Algoriphagus sediminis TaxID=3057113 RepID=A0ABT7YBS8_9BACT|nr:hypothetical protein [Algoriphagus sediminis]MDN3203974.1 hypothetical protein [Algoriphagus sediminis]